MPTSEDGTHKTSFEDHLGNSDVLTVIAGAAEDHGKSIVMGIAVMDEIAIGKNQDSF